MILRIRIDEEFQLPNGITGVLLEGSSASSLELGEGQSFNEEDVYQMVGTQKLPLIDTIKKLEDSKKKLLSEVTSYLKAVPDLMVRPPDTYGVIGGSTGKSQSDMTPSIKAVSTKAKPGKFGANDLVLLYNEVATRNKWQRVVKLGEKLKKMITPALKQFPEKADWELILQGWEDDDFFSGKSGVYGRPKILTMLYSSRYESFYNAAVDALENPDPAKLKEEAKNQFMNELNEFLGFEKDAHLKGGF